MMRPLIICLTEFQKTIYWHLDYDLHGSETIGLKAIIADKNRVAKNKKKGYNNAVIYNPGETQVTPAAIVLPRAGMYNTRP
jgi:hypothetical protein